MTRVETLAAGCPPAEAPRTVCFSVHAAADPGLLPRVIGLWAKRGLTPARWHSALCGSDDREIYIDVEMSAVTPALAQQIAGELRRIYGVSQVLMTLDGGRVSA